MPRTKQTPSKVNIFVLRGTPLNPILPPVAVIKLNKYGCGKDIAWFFKEEDAKEYIKFQEDKKP